MQDLPYRPNVCLLIFNKNNLIFVGERKDCPNIWQFPQGGVEPEFSLEENAIKEACEELGVKKDLLKIRKKLAVTHKYDFQKPPEYAIGKWRGQEQTFWVLDFLGQDSDIKLDLHTPEFMSFKWVEVSFLPNIVEAKRWPSYKKSLVDLGYSFG
jgi:putative (di)nucleoside polyphosphate hydrolase